MEEVYREGFKAAEININMRCIEMRFIMCFTIRDFRININMRCIEINFKIAVRGKLPEININMRCIEMFAGQED